MKQNKRLFITVIIIGVILSLMFIFLGFVFLGNIFGEDKFTPNFFNALTFGMTIIFMTILYFYINGRSLIITIQNDNEYNLGERSTFNNLYAFQKKVELRFKLD